MSLHQLGFLMERLWLTAKTCDIFRATAVNLGIICSNLNQRKSSRLRNSQDLIGIFCSGPFAPSCHELTLNEWAAIQRGKSHDIVSVASCLCGQRGMQEAELVGSLRSCGFGSAVGQARGSGAVWGMSAVGEMLPQLCSAAQAQH